MHNRLSRILTRWLKTHPQFGIVPMCAAVTMDAGDEDLLLLGGQRLPVTVYNDVDDECLVPQFNPDVVPALCVIPQLSTNSPVRRGRGQIDYDKVSVGMSYIERGEKEILSRLRGGYVLEAVLHSMIAFQNPAYSALPISGASPMTWRQLGNVEVVDVSSIEEYRITLGLGTSSMFGSIVPSFKVRQFVAQRA